MWELILSERFAVLVLAAGIRVAAPLLLTALGEIYSERSGILNIALEGQMLVGALVGFLGAFYSGNLVVGLILGALGGLAFSLLVALFCVTLRAPQVVIGIIMNLLAFGLTTFFYRVVFGTPLLPPHVSRMNPVNIPFLSDIPVLGPVLFQQTPIVYIVFLLVPVAAFALFRTSAGLRVRTVGEFPLAAETLGVNVNLTRYICVALSGLTSGLAGAMISVTQLARFVEDITAGRGFIALAIVIFSRWSPYRALLAALVFGLVDSLQMGLQAVGSPIPSQFMLMLPYIVTVIVIATSRKSMPPAALAQPYIKEEG